MSTKAKMKLKRCSVIRSRWELIDAMTNRKPRRNIYMVLMQVSLFIFIYWFDSYLCCDIVRWMGLTGWTAGYWMEHLVVVSFSISFAIKIWNVANLHSHHSLPLARKKKIMNTNYMCDAIDSKLPWMNMNIYIYMKNDVLRVIEMQNTRNSKCETWNISILMIIL